jgi:hypothetical protein
MKGVGSKRKKKYEDGVCNKFNTLKAAVGRVTQHYHGAGEMCIVPLSNRVAPQTPQSTRKKK